MVQKDQHTSRPVWAGVDFSLKENASNRKKTKGNADRHNEKNIGCKKKRDRGAKGTKKDTDKQMAQKKTKGYSAKPRERNRACGKAK